MGIFKKKKVEEKKATKKKTTTKKKASPKVPSGLETRTQIKQFQLENGLLPTGLLDEATLEKAKK
jgi:murein L,D-transpeptidase YcbB/YkuD